MPKAAERNFIGLYVDGGRVNAARIAVRGNDQQMRPRLTGYARREVSPGLTGRIEAARAGKLTLSALAELDRDVGCALGVVARDLADTGPVASIGSSGVPVAPGVELGRPAALAQEAGVPVAARFADSDLAAGGNGTAVCAWPDWRMLRDERWSRVLVHLGDMASLTFVGSAAAACEVVAFDVGPGVGPLEALARELYEHDDAEGASAARGEVNAALLNELLAERFFRAPVPRGAEPGRWGSDYLARVWMMARKGGCEGESLLATMAESVARAVARAIAGLTERPHDVVLAGRGAASIHLAARIRDLMCPSSTVPAGKFGLPAEAWRAVSHAMLAAARLDGFAAHCAAASGAAGAAVLGSVTSP